jgi:hypothetical protein
VLSSLQGVTCGGKQSWWQIDDEQFLRCCSRELEKGLIQSAGEFSFLDISDLSTGMAILFRGGRSLNVHQNLSKVLWPNFEIHCKSEKLQQCEAIRRRLLLTEEGRSAAEEVIELRHSQPREWYKEQVWLLKHGEISANPMLPWDPGNEDSRLRDILPFLLLATGNTKLLLPWDPGDLNIGIRDIMLLLQSVTSDVRLTLPWDPGEQEEGTKYQVSPLELEVITMFTIASGDIHMQGTVEYLKLTNWQFLSIEYGIFST